MPPAGQAGEGTALPTTVWTLHEIGTRPGGLARAVTARGEQSLTGLQEDEDLHDDETFLRIVETRDGARRDWVHLRLPAGTVAGRKGRPGTPEEARLETLIDRCAAIGDRQREQGKHFSIEGPASAGAWEAKSLRRLASQPGTATLDAERCGYGETRQGPFRVITNCPWLRRLRRCACARPHLHEAGEGADPAEQGEYPAKLLEEWVDQWQEWARGRPAPPLPASKYVTRRRFQNVLVRQELSRPPGPGETRS